MQQPCPPDLSYFYPRPPRGGRLAAQRVRDRVGVISIHALREEGDSMPSPALILPGVFLSTPSARRATSAARYYEDL